MPYATPKTAAERKAITARNLEARRQARLIKSAAQSYNVGSDHPKAKLTEEAVRHIRASEESPQALAERYGVGVNYIGSIRRGRVWKHVS